MKCIKDVAAIDVVGDGGRNGLARGAVCFDCSLFAEQEPKREEAE